MDSVKLTNLPFETLQQIAGYLHDTHRSSLYNLASTSQACHKFTLQSVFREVHLPVHSHKALQRNVDALVKVLSGSESAHYVRHLSIKGFLLLNIEESDNPGNEVGTSTAPKMNWHQLSGVVEVVGDDEAPYLGGDFFLDEAIEVSPAEDMAWAPIVHLLETLPHLTKLVYDCGNQFPPSLLDALHKHHPQCKLHHLTFRLRSLRSEILDPHEMAIATSPCLHKVKTRYAWRDSSGEDDFHVEAMPEFVAGLAPNLREVLMVQLNPAASNNWRHRLRFEREPWRGLPGCVPGRRLGSLTSLSLTGFTSFDPEFLQSWNQRTDFGSLTHLALGGDFFKCHGGINAEALEWMVQNCSFPRLKTLRIRLDRDHKNDLTQSYANDAINFFGGLEPLHELLVDGPLDPDILDTILSRHGHSLRKLGLWPAECRFFENQPHMPLIFELEHIQQIQAQCPELQDLAISIKRTKSDAREAEIYRSFSKMERLQVLFLTLDCSDWEVTRSGRSTDNPLFGDEEREFYCDRNERLRMGHVQDTFLNCAVDETLARSIWKTICREKAGKRLESLKLHTTGGGNFGDSSGHSDIAKIVDHLSRSWLIEQSVRDDEDVISVRELGREAREARDIEATEFYDRNCRGDRTGAGLPEHSAVHICRRIWGSQAGGQDWRQNWASLPLSGS